MPTVPLVAMVLFRVNLALRELESSLVGSSSDAQSRGLYMAIHTCVIAAVAAGLIFASSVVLGDDAPPQATKQTVPVQNPNCLTHTGSRIDTKGKCRGTGRSYTSEDLARTGKTTVGGALPLLDPSITVHH
jgi:hypothetical protein